MKWEQLFISIFLMSSFLMHAQQKSDFEIMVGRSIEKLYKNPDEGISCAKKINVKDDNSVEKLIIRTILAEAYSLKGNYVEAVQIALVNTNSSNFSQKKDQLLINLSVIQRFQDIGLYEHSEILAAPVLQDLSTVKNKKGHSIAKIYQLHAYNLFALKNHKKSLENLHLSDRSIPTNSSASYIITCENKILAGKIALQKKDLRTAEKYFDEVLNILRKHPENNYLLSVMYLNQAEILFLQKENSAAADLLNTALQKIEEADFLLVKNEIYSSLAKNYLVLRQNDEYRNYRKKYEDSQDTIEENKKEAVRNLMKLSQGFQTQNYNSFISEKQQNLYISGGFILLIIFSLVFLNNQEKQKQITLEKQVLFFEKQNKLYADKENIIAEQKKISPKKTLIIPKEKEQDLMQKLQKFEQSERFLEKNMSLALLAAQLETNTKYLSEVINKYKEKNFTSYINQLKINHIAYLISSNPTFRQYKISYLAEYAGFTSHSSFTIVFKSVTGMSPNDYLQQVKNRKIK